MKNEKGITLTVLATTVAIMIVLLATIVLNINHIRKNEMVDKLYYDLEILKNKINIYYWKYGQLPVKSLYNFSIPDGYRNPNDDNNYYEIDLNALGNLTLQTDEFTFVINEATHTIYIAEGFEINGETHYRLPEEYSNIQ